MSCSSPSLRPGPAIVRKLAHRRVVAGAGFLTLLVAHAGLAFGQTYPGKVVRILTSPTGSSSDFTARLIAQGLTERLGKPFIVDNRGNISGELVSRAPADGYTLLVDSISFWIAPLLQKMPYDSEKDFSPISVASVAPYVLVVHPNMPVKNLKELIALARARPGAINYGSAGNGGTAHLAGELFKSMAKINLVHVPYNGSAAVAIGIISGQVQLTFANPASVVPYMTSGKLRALAVTSVKPSAMLPGLPTMDASGLPGFEVTATVALLAPAKTPEAIINLLNAETRRVLSKAGTRQHFLDIGVEAVGSSPQELAATIKADLLKWGAVIREAHIRSD